MAWAETAGGPGQATPNASPPTGPRRAAQQPTVDQLAAAEAGPDAGNPPPPPSETSYDDLSRRVAELEQRLARGAEMEAAAKQQAAGKPLIAPSGRIQFDVANFSQNAASVAQFGDVQNAVGLPPGAGSRCWARPSTSSTTSSRWISPTAASASVAQLEGPVHRRSRTSTSRCGNSRLWATSASATSRSASAWSSSPATTTPPSWSGRSTTKGRSSPAATTASWPSTGPRTSGPPGRSARSPTIPASISRRCSSSTTGGSTWRCAAPPALVRRAQRRARPVPHRHRLRLPQRPGPHPAISP